MTKKDTLGGAQPKFSTIADRDKQYIINSRDLEDGNTVQVNKLSSSGKLVPLLKVEVPRELIRQDEPKPIREFILKEVRKAQAFAKAKAIFEQSSVELLASAQTFIEEGLVTTEDKRTTRHEEAANKSAARRKNA